MSGSGISWAVCKSAPRARQITTPALHHLVFYRPDALPAAQPTASLKAHTLPDIVQHKWCHIPLFFKGTTNSNIFPKTYSKTFWTKKDILCCKFFNSARAELGMLWTIEIQVEPMCQFHLEQQSDWISTFLFGNVDHKTPAVHKQFCFTIFSC